MSKASSKKTIPTYGKQDIEQCMSNFRLLVLNNIDDVKKIKANLISSGKMSHSEKEFIRAFSWRIFLGTITVDDKSSLKTWIDETISKRKQARKLIKSLNVNKLKGDPLGGLGNNEGKKDSEGWDSFFNQSESIKLINLDVERTMPNEKLFQEPYIREMENTILKLFAKNHKELSYKQGMNEVLSLLIYAIYPYYVKSSTSKYTDEIIDKWVKDPVTNFKEIYHFFHDENELESDLYYMMENLMMKFGLAKFFEEEDRDKNITPYLVIRAENIITKKLPQQDRQMYTHFKAQNLDHSMVFQRWLKCLFKRELPLKNVCLIWDNLFANEAENPTGELICLDYMVLALILNIKDDLIRRDNNAMYEMLLKYPEILQFNQIINLSEKIKDSFSNNIFEQDNEPSSTANEQQANPQEPSKVEDGKQVQNPNPNNMMPINPLLFNPNLMMNPQMQANLVNNPNMMFYPYNAMMAQQMSQAQAQTDKKNDFVVLSKNDLSPMDKIKGSYQQSDTSSVNALKEIKEIANKYKNAMSVEDKNRLDFLIDSLSQKL